MMPRALDLFCGGGGAAKGLVEAGFEVFGVDAREQPEYPYEMVVADALDYPFDGFDFVWASPPCQRFSHATRDKSRHQDLIDPIRERLVASGLPYVIENVVGAKKFLRDPVMLCGAMFGLGVVRHRLFECSWPVRAPEHVKHKGSIVTGEYVTVAGNGGVPSWTLRERERRGLPRHIPGEMTLERWQEAMGIDWLSRKPLVQAIPPAFSRFIGEQAMSEFFF
jgi:DNA (cytosine-5)-methyltransferase 1